MNDLRRIPKERFPARLAACREAIAERGFAALLIGVGPDLRYLTGFVGEPMERLTLLVVPREGPVSFVVPRLEAEKARATPLVSGGAATVVAFDETDDAAALVAADPGPWRRRLHGLGGFRGCRRCHRPRRPDRPVGSAVGHARPAAADGPAGPSTSSPPGW